MVAGSRAGTDESVTLMHDGRKHLGRSVGVGEHTSNDAGTRRINREVSNAEQPSCRVADVDKLVVLLEESALVNACVVGVRFLENLGASQDH